jgi:hypothetical protein
MKSERLTRDQAANLGGTENDQDIRIEKNLI